MESAQKDSLTGLVSHSAFQIALGERFKAARMRHLRLCCMIADIDYFHALNRSMGYSFGDAALVQIAELLRTLLPQDAVISRFSGEQFGILVEVDANHKAISLAETLRKTIADHKFVYQSQSTFLTMSIGLAVSDERTKEASELLSFAQLVLRTAKREGRNRVCYWERELISPANKPAENIVVELQKKFAELEREVKAFGTSEVRSLLDELDIPDGMPESHAENVAFIAASIADEMGLNDKQIDTIISAALLHDIGKLGIDPDILSKSGSLTPEEFEEIKKHPLLGAEFLQAAEFFEKELPLIRHHHERYDGRGYPDGLKGDQIPLGARIIGLAEAIDGLLSGSIYREPMSIKEAIEELRRCSGSQFDPELVNIAVRLLETGRIG
ncbi:MAG: diguanylate cyclase [candidate division KSB1 bacterium]|nr:diguanylate cyclase [candidate division KSB1 bacterium]MDQ7063164.1 diguanylate cyclase [candidate division KSB1 bacterium]